MRNFIVGFLSAALLMLIAFLVWQLYESGVDIKSYMPWTYERLIDRSLFTYQESEHAGFAVNPDAYYKFLPYLDVRGHSYTNYSRKVLRLRIYVWASGKVAAVDVMNDVSLGDTLLGDIASAAIMKWKFHPALMGGHTVNGTVNMTLKIPFQYNVGMPMNGSVVIKLPVYNEPPVNIVKRKPVPEVPYVPYSYDKPFIYRECDVQPKPIKELPIIWTSNVGDKDALHGNILLEVLVYKDGTVYRVNVMHHLSPAYDRAAVESVRRWVFSPGLNDMRPMDTRTYISISVPDGEIHQVNNKEY